MGVPRRAALLSGLSAAVGSVLVKLALQQEGPLKLLLLALALAANALMMRYLALGMEGSATTAAAVVLTSSANFVFSGALAYLLLGEPLGLRWVAGVALIAAGTALCASDE